MEKSSMFIEGTSPIQAVVSKNVEPISTPTPAPIIQPVPIQPMVVSGDVDEGELEVEETPVVEASPKIDRRKGAKKIVDPITGEVSYGFKADGSKKMKPGRKPKAKTE